MTSQATATIEVLEAVLADALRLADALDLPGVAVYVSMARDSLPDREQPR